MSALLSALYHRRFDWARFRSFSFLNSQRDQNGNIGPGTYPSVVSEAGCIVLAVDEKPVKFLENTGTREVE